MKVIFSMVILLLSSFGFAQNGINYKAIIKNNLGSVVANQIIDVQFTILQGVSQTNVYQETHTPSTDANGLIIVNIGEGNTSNVFTDIDWGSDDHFLNVKIDTGSGLVDLGTTQFMAVPYALSSSDSYWSKNGNDIYTFNSSVGINSATPEYTLDVRSTSQTNPSEFNLSNNDKSRFLRFFSGSETFPDPSLLWAPNHSFLFAAYDDNTYTFEEYMRISSLGDVGIGIDNPQARLDIRGGDWNLDAGNAGDLRIGNETNNFRIGIATGGGGAGVTRMYTNSNALILGVNNTPSLLLEPNGEIKAPSMTNSIIESAGNKSLVTKEYLDDALTTNSETKTITFPAAYFEPSRSTQTAAFIRDDIFAYFISGSEWMYAPITLPEGSVITEIKIYVLDSSNLTNIQATLISSIGYGPTTTVLLEDTTNSNLGNQLLTLSGTVPILSDTQYVVRIVSTLGDWSNMGVFKMVVTYTE